MSPSLSGDGAWRSAKVVVEFVATIVAVWCTRVGDLGEVLVLLRSELPSSLGGLLELLLLLSVGVSQVDGQLLAIGLNGVVVEGLDDLFTSVARVEAVNAGQ